MITLAQADDAPRDGQVLIREWLDYVARRVPGLQGEGAKEKRRIEQKRVGAMSEEAQRPRVFYKREADDRQLVAKP